MIIIILILIAHVVVISACMAIANDCVSKEVVSDYNISLKRVSINDLNEKKTIIIIVASYVEISPILC